MVFVCLLNPNVHLCACQVSVSVVSVISSWLFSLLNSNEVPFLWIKSAFDGSQQLFQPLGLCSFNSLLHGRCFTCLNLVCCCYMNPPLCDQILLVVCLVLCSVRIISHLAYACEISKWRYVHNFSQEVGILFMNKWAMGGLNNWFMMKKNKWYLLIEHGCVIFVATVYVDCPEVPALGRLTSFRQEQCWEVACLSAL